MSDTTTYLKCACNLCAGHIEFPAEAEGVTVECPHCGGKTRLEESERGKGKGENRGQTEGERVLADGHQVKGEIRQQKARRGGRKRILLPMAFAAVGVGLFVVVLAGSRGRSFLVEQVRLSPGAEQGGREVAGTVLNTSGRTRRAVRVKVDLLNERGETLWQATDFAAEMAPHGSWEFRALVLDPAVVRAKVAEVSER